MRQLVLRHHKDQGKVLLILYSQGFQHSRQLLHTTDMFIAVGHLQTILLRTKQRAVDDGIVRNRGHTAVAVLQSAQVIDVADQLRIASAQTHRHDLSGPVVETVEEVLRPSFEE